MLFSESVHHWVVIALQYVELGVVLVRLTVRKRCYHKFSFEFGHASAFPEDCRHGFICIWYSYFQLFWIVTVSEDIIPFKSLTSIACHIALDSDLIIFLLLDTHRNEFGDPWSARMVDLVFLLESCHSSHLITSKQSFFLI